MNRWMKRLLAAGMLLLGGSMAFAQQNSQPVKILAGYAPGGNVDIVARLLAKAMSESMGRPVIVENRPGGGGQLAAELLKNAAPDGSTLMLAPDAAVVVRPATMRKPTFNPVRDFVAVAETGSQDYGFAVPADLPVKDLNDFAVWARAHPKEANYASAGVGGITHMGSILIGQAIKAPLEHVPFNGSAPAVNALIGGVVTATFQPVGTLITQAQAGKIRVLAVSGAKRSAIFPDVPTFAETGHPEINIVTWFGLFAPAKTPAPLVARYNQEVIKALQQPQIRAQMQNLGLDVTQPSSEEFGAQVHRDMDRWAAVVKNAGITLED
jgi:tripartite-type tricarboxylate transporter receptor subunit TctC